MNLPFLCLLASAQALLVSTVTAQMEAINPHEKPKADDATVLLLDFEDTADGVAKDRSPRSNHGAIHDAQPCEGPFGKALNFDGADDYVDCKGERDTAPAFDFDETSDLTVELFMRTDTVISQNLINKKCSTNVHEPGWMILTTPVGKMIALISDGRQGVTVENPVTVADGNWHHIALVFDRKNGATLFVDGAPGETVAIHELGALTNTNRALRIGDRANDGDFRGAIDEVRISNVARQVIR